MKTSTMVLLWLAACGPKGGGAAGPEVTNQPERPAAGAVTLPDGEVAIEQAYVWVSYDDVEGWAWMHVALLGDGAPARSCDEVAAALDPAALAPFVLYASEGGIEEEEPTAVPGWGGYAEVHGRSIPTGAVDLKVTERRGETWVVELSMSEPVVTGRVSATWCGDRVMPEAPAEEG
jgi:hypothetical protein